MPGGDGVVGDDADGSSVGRAARGGTAFHNHHAVPAKHANARISRVQVRFALNPNRSPQTLAETIQHAPSSAMPASERWVSSNAA